MITLFCVRPKGFNVGNDAIFLGMQRYIFEAFGQVVNIINLPATSRYESHAKSGLTAQTIWEINLYGDGVIVGGGNLYENGEIQVDLQALKALEVPLMLFSLSHGKVYNRHGELVERTNAIPDAVTKTLNSHAMISLARDDSTCEYLHRLGATNARTGGCPTIFLDRVMNRLPQLYPPDQSGVLISVRQPSLMSISLQKQGQVQSDIRRIVAFLKSEGHSRIRLLCHDHRDIPFAASFSDLEFIYLDDIYTYLALLNSCSLNITYRLHSALPCLSFGRPTIPISYDERAISLLRTIGYADWNINMVESGDVATDVIDRYRRLNELQSRKEKCKLIWDSLDKTMIAAFKEFSEEVNRRRTSPL